MKILIVSKCQTHKPTAGNRRFILNQIDLLRQLGHEVHFLFIKEYALSKKYRVPESELELMSDYFKQYYHQYNVSLLQN